MTFGKHHAAGKSLTVALILIGAFVGSRFLPFGEWLHHFAEWARGQGPAGWIVFGAGYVAGTLLFVPGSVLTLAASVLFGFWPAALLVWLSATTGASLAFLIARFAARDAIARQVDRHPKFKELDAAIGEQGWKIVLLLRLSPLIPFNLSNYFYGLTKIGFGPYVLSSAVGMIPGTVLFVYLGQVGRAALGGSEASRGVAEYGYLGLGLVATVAVTVYLSRLAKKALRPSLPIGNVSPDRR